MNQTESPSIGSFPRGLDDVSNNDIHNSTLGLFAAIQQRWRSSVSSEVDQRATIFESMVSVSAYDILSTRGQPKHLGTLRYRELILQYKIEFDASKCAKNKRALIIDIIKELAPGRFLRPYKTDGEQDTYEVMDLRTVYKKVLNAMKDCKSEENYIYTSLHKIKAEKKHLMNSIRKKRNYIDTKRQCDTVWQKKKRECDDDVLEMKINQQSEIELFHKNLESIKPMGNDYFYTNDKEMESNTQVSQKKQKTIQGTVFPETLSSKENQFLTEFGPEWNNFEDVHEQQSEIDMSGLRYIFESNC